MEDLTKLGLSELQVLSRKLQGDREKARIRLRTVNNQIAERQLAAQIAERWKRMSPLEQQQYSQLAQGVAPTGIKSAEKVGKQLQ